MTPIKQDRSLPFRRYHLRPRRMKILPPEPHQIDRVLDRGEAAVGVIRRFFASYFWIIFKNVVGWLLILLSLPAGVALPGPGGLPMALIGFALVAFPGKRRITSHVLRGRPLRIEASIFTSLTTVASLLVIGVLLYLVSGYYQRIVAYFHLDPSESTPGFIAGMVVLCGLAAVVTWGVMRLGLLFVNKLIRLIPRIRRFIRPILRKYGVVLLPPPKHGHGLEAGRETVEILELSEHSRARVQMLWAGARPWVVRITAVVVTATLFYFVIQPTVQNWRAVEPSINRIRPIDFLIAVGLFALCLVLYRVSSWAMIVRAFGQPLAPAAAARVWSTSELARYLPGSPKPMSVRVQLSRLLNVPIDAATSSFVLESAIFFLANFAVGISALLCYGIRNASGDLRWWMIGALAIFPLLVLLSLHPRVFYRFIDRFLEAVGRAPVERKLGMPALMLLLLWNVAGLAVMSLALWLILRAPLALPLAQWWVGAAAYCIAWMVGYFAAWAPAGLGVREIVFMGVLLLVMPTQARIELSPHGVVAFAGVLALIVRVWSVAGEVTLALGSYALDVRGALDSVRGNRPVRRQD
jgi:hypothetical protein